MKANETYFCSPGPNLGRGEVLGFMPASPSPRPSPLGRGGIVFRHLANTRLASARELFVNQKTHNSFPLSPRERVRVRGNTPLFHTKQSKYIFRTAIEKIGRVLHFTRTSPSPRPSPLGRGRIDSYLIANPWLASTWGRFTNQKTHNSCSLSLRERVRVRGNAASIRPYHSIITS